MQVGKLIVTEGSLPSRRDRQVRRELRRAKQREANITRAEKMHAARVSDHFKIPVPARTKKSETVPDTSFPQIHVGCSGWFYWHWRETFYPAALATNQWFAYYARRFKTVELNAPFYSWPTISTVNSWNRQAWRRDFIYTIKVCELITHIKRFKGTKRLIQDFYYIADLLGQRMGCFLFQLPPSFHFSPARLAAILAQLDTQRRNVVEFRHRSWWCEPVFKAFRKAGIVFCSCSGPRLPDQLVKTSDDIYIRFHGTTQWYRHNYTREELAVWAERIQSSGAKRVWAYFNNDREGHAIQNAKEFMRLLRKP